MLGDSRPPAFKDLVEDLRLVRERGIARLRGVALPALQVAARLCGMGSDQDQDHDPAAVEELLRVAVTAIDGGRFGTAAEYTFGLIQGTRMWSATERRTGAAKAQGVSKERFRKGYEPQIVEAIAEGILALISRSSQSKEQSGPADNELATQAAAPGKDYVLLRTLDTADDFTLGRLLPSARVVDIYSRAPVHVLSRYAVNLSRVVLNGGLLRVAFLASDALVGDHVYPMAIDGQAVLARNMAIVRDRINYIRHLTDHAAGAEFRTTTTLHQYGMTAVYGPTPAESKMVVQMSLPYTRTETDRPLICLTPESTWFGVFEQEFQETWERAAPHPT